MCDLKGAQRNRGGEDENETVRAVVVLHVARRVLLLLFYTWRAVVVAVVVIDTFGARRE